MGCKVVTYSRWNGLRTGSLLSEDVPVSASMGMPQNSAGSSHHLWKNKMVARMSNLARKLTTSLAAAKKDWRSLGLIISLIVACRVMCQEDKPLVHRFRPGDTVTFSCNGLQVGVPPTAHVREMYVLKEGYGVVYRYNKYDPLERVPSPDHWNFRAEGAEKADANSGSFNVTVEISDMMEVDRGVYSCMASYDDVGGNGSVKRIQKQVAVLVFAGEAPVTNVELQIVVTLFVTLTVLVLVVILGLLVVPRRWWQLPDNLNDQGEGDELQGQSDDDDASSATTKGDSLLSQDTQD